MNDLMTNSFVSYVDLKKQAQADLKAENQDIENCHVITTTQPDEQKLFQFFEQVDPIKSEMEEINSLLIDLQTLNAETKSTHSAKVLRGLRDRMDADVALVLRKVKTVKSKLESLDKSNEIKEETAVDRTKASVTNGLRFKLRELMNDFQTLREMILSDHKEFLKKRYYNATGEVATEEVVEKMISGDLKMDFFSETKTETVLENKERHEAVIDIQKSLEKLHQVFLDMAVLVEAQGEKIDDIEHNVEIAGSFVSGGTDDLFYAKQNKKKKKWFFCVWLVGLLILLGWFIYVLNPFV